MKKNYFLTLVVTLLMAVTASAADSLVGIYKLSNLTDEQTEALGSINADAAIRILPGDDQADYYISSFAGYGCNLPATYDAEKGTLTATANPVLFPSMILLLYSYTGAVAVDNETITLSVANESLSIAEELIILDAMKEDVIGTYIPGMTFEKQNAPALTATDLVGSYTFTAENVNLIWGGEETAEFSLIVSQKSGNQLSIAGLIDNASVSAIYYPEVGMISIPVQEVGDYIIAQMASEFGDVRFIVSNDGEWSLITPLQAAAEMPLFYLTNGTATKTGTNGIEKTIEKTAAISVANGAIYVNSAGPVAVQVYNAAGVHVYADAAVNGPITLPRGIYFVKVGSAKAVSVAL